MKDMKINKEENYVSISVNTKIYPLDVIYSAAYVFIDKFYILLDGNPKKNVVVELRPKDKYELEKLGREFLNEILNYATYKTMSEKNKGIRLAIIQRALLTNTMVEEGNSDYVDDPERIAIPWEKKYGKKTKNKSKK